MNDGLLTDNASHTYGPNNTDSLTILAAHENATHDTALPIKPPPPEPSPLAKNYHHQSTPSLLINGTAYWENTAIPRLVQAELLCQKNNERQKFMSFKRCAYMTCILSSNAMGAQTSLSHPSNLSSNIYRTYPTIISVV